MLPLAGAFRVSNPTALLTIYNTAFDNNTDGFKFGYSSAYHHSFSASFNSSASLNNLGINIKSDIDRLVELYKDASSTRGLVWLAQEVKEGDFNWDKWLNKTIKQKDLNKIVEDSKYVQDTFISDTTYANVVFSGIAGWFVS